MAFPSEASCNEEQLEVCRDPDPFTNSNWGECRHKPYMEFSHLCVQQQQQKHNQQQQPYLNHSKRSTLEKNDDTTTLCCRYHQDWNHFRCQGSDDVIDKNLNGSNKVVDMK
ncbi:hypothetical protein HELRODRAFT_189230 [Helobdella robusta]|uniref:Uncharacterized protein n=1 Tax=Helobdella robusta TaxID=6412 RepID=T1FQU2_HELRO|nr:hypothetical protein HELRODRAFT_189230 [Helobdella robusta]ESN96412.1 hypothetical protein HELRODRAFT_189230 [Helobdella robusta]